MLVSKPKMSLPRRVRAPEGGWKNTFTPQRSSIPARKSARMSLSALIALSARNVKLGDKVRLIAHVVIDGRTQSIGSETIVYPFASLGQRPQDLKFKGEETANWKSAATTRSANM